MGSGGNSAQRAAEQQEAQRQRQITASTGRINNVFDNPDRQAQYGQLVNDTQQFYQSDLDRQKGDTDRKLKFAMARSGQTGGSVAADTNQRVGEDYLRGTVEASRRAQQAGAGLRQSDEQARASLLAMAQSGLDATTAASRSAESMQNNLMAGRAGATANQLGDMFGNFADIYKRSQERAAETKGRKYDFGTQYQPMFGYGDR